MLKFLQKIGKSLMLPVATLPAAGILQGLALINYETDIPLGPGVGGFLNHYVTPFLKYNGWYYVLLFSLCSVLVVNPRPLKVNPLKLICQTEKR